MIVDSTQTLSLNTMRLINLGCGENRLLGWENYDADLDLTKLPLPFEDASVDRVLLEHILEHISCDEAYLLFEELYRVLKPGGIVRICVPDITQVATKDDGPHRHFYRRMGWHDPIKSLCVDHGHKSLWTIDLLATVLTHVGFSLVRRSKPRESFDDLLKGVDGHHRMIGEQVNDVETLVVEAIK